MGHLANEGACTDTLEVIWTVTDAVGLSSSAVQLVALGCAGTCGSQLA